MRRIYEDWTIDVVEIVHPNYGRGFRATAFIAKTDGTKANIHEIGCYGCNIKTYTQMFEHTKKLLEI